MNGLRERGKARVREVAQVGDGGDRVSAMNVWKIRETIAYHYKGMLARQHTVYCIQAICHQAINMDIVLQQFGKFSDMVLSVSAVVVSVR